MDRFHIIQTNIMMGVGIVSFFLSFFILFMGGNSSLKKISIAGIAFSSAVILFSDAFAAVYRGHPGPEFHTLLHILNFLTFFFTAAIICFYTLYVRCSFFPKNPPLSVPKRFIICYDLSILSIILVIINPFTGIFYTIGTDNLYTRAPLFFLSYIIPVIILCLVMSVAVENRKEIRLINFLSIMLFGSVPFIAAVVQYIFYGTALLNISIGVAAIILFINEMQSQTIALRHAASTDFITDIPNAIGIRMYLKGHILAHKIGYKYTAFYFDIKNFGITNRKYGTKVGDLALKAYAQEIKSHLDKNEFVGRLGGNFFFAFVYKENIDEFLTLLQKVPVDINLNGKLLHMDYSAVAGIYQIEKTDNDENTVLENTGIAFTLAKTILNKSYVILTPELKARFSLNRQLEQQIPQGMEKNEFVPYYQPKVDSKTKQLIGAEALVRWVSQEKGIVSPDKFIPILEKNDSICQLDFYMLEHVCADIKKWNEMGLNPPKISVNFSRKNLSNPMLANDINNILKKYDVGPAFIEIEIIETGDDYPLSDLKKFVNDLHSFGISVAIDDFGTGRSSMCLLCEIDFDVLKIDKSFVDHLRDKDIKILTHIVKLSSEMGITIIAEGVETESQLYALTNLGCINIQGYLFDKPLHKEDFLDRLKDPQY